MSEDTNPFLCIDLLSFCREKNIASATMAWHRNLNLEDRLMRQKLVVLNFLLDD